MVSSIIASNKDPKKKNKKAHMRNLPFHLCSGLSDFIVVLPKSMPVNENKNTVNTKNKDTKPEYFTSTGPDKVPINEESMKIKEKKTMKKSRPITLYAKRIIFCFSLYIKSVKANNQHSIVGTTKIFPIIKYNSGKTVRP